MASVTATHVKSPPTRGGTAKGFLSVASVLIMIASAIVVSPSSAVTDITSSDSWSMSITIDNTSGGLSVSYTKNGSAMSTVAVSGTKSTIEERSGGSESAWAFDEATGYGPFNSFYAAFDPEGGIICHLNPNNLAKSVDGRTAVNGIEIADCNIMWVLPRVYVTATNSGVHVDGDVSKEYTSGTIILSSSGSEEDLYPAFDVDGKSYRYLALGVYEASVESDRLSSKTGSAPVHSTSLEDLRAYANNNAQGEGTDVKVSQVFNYYQWQLYRILSIGVMGSFDSQNVIGYGNGKSTQASITGIETDDKGAYYGKKEADSKTSSSKLFIENSWGSLSEVLDNVVFNNGLNAGTNGYAALSAGTGAFAQVSTERGGSQTFGTFPYHTDVDSWGLPAEFSSSLTSSAPDEFFLRNGYDVSVGGNYKYVKYGGISSMLYHNETKDNLKVLYGTRLAFLLDIDSVSEAEVSLSVSNGTCAIGNILVSVGDTVTLSDNTLTIGAQKVTIVPDEDYPIITMIDVDGEPIDKITVSKSLTLSIKCSEKPADDSKHRQDDDDDVEEFDEVIDAPRISEEDIVAVSCAVGAAVALMVMMMLMINTRKRS